MTHVNVSHFAGEISGLILYKTKTFHEFYYVISIDGVSLQFRTLEEVGQLVVELKKATDFLKSNQLRDELVTEFLASE